MKIWVRLKNWAYWLIVITRDTCSSYFPNPWKTGRHFSSRSFKGRAPKALEREILKRCLKLLKENRKQEGICKSRRYYLEFCLAQNWRYSISFTFFHNCC